MYSEIIKKNDFTIHDKMIYIFFFIIILNWSWVRIGPSLGPDPDRGPPFGDACPKRSSAACDASEEAQVRGDGGNRFAFHRISGHKNSKKQ